MMIITVAKAAVAAPTMIITIIMIIRKTTIKVLFIYVMTQ